ncbi:MAG: hypothetical protein QGH62_04710 [Nitrospinaceae bacterium]|nr:hypothetical protein [Nitrospinaceae bacterium]
MPLKSCHECNAEISTKAVVCPRCGVPQRKGPFSRKVLLWIAVIYSALFWFFFHPFWTEQWVTTLGGNWITTSNFLCSLVYLGGILAWQKLFP